MINIFTKINSAAELKQLEGFKNTNNQTSKRFKHLTSYISIVKRTDMSHENFAKFYHENAHDIYLLLLAMLSK